MDLREEIGDVKALGDEGKEALESFAFLGVEFAFEQRGDVYVVRIVVQVSVRTDSKHDCGCLTQCLGCGAELREHFQSLSLCFRFTVVCVYVYREREFVVYA